MARLSRDEFLKRIAHNWSPWFGIDEEVYEFMIENPQSVMLFGWFCEQQFSGRLSIPWDKIYNDGRWTNEGLEIVNSWRLKHKNLRIPEIEWV